MISFFLYFFLFSFLLNFVWEISQIPLYRSEGLGDYSDVRYAIKIRWRVSIFDAITIFIAYSAVSLIAGNWLWFEAWNWPWALFIGGLLAWQIGMEYVSVFRLHRWAYSEAMPEIFGIGISPLLQMIVLPALSIILAAKVL